MAVSAEWPHCPHLPEPLPIKAWHPLSGDGQRDRRALERRLTRRREAPGYRMMLKPLAPPA